MAEARASLGYFSPLAARWEQQRVTGRGDCRHHLAVGAEVEDAFWASFGHGDGLDAACRAAGISRATAYRWWRRRFMALREQGVSVRSAARKLRLPRERSAAWEAECRKAHERTRRERAAAEQRRRPREPKLAANPALRKLVQRKLNRCWSPDEISGWLRRTYPDDESMWLCAETIYRALLVPGGKGLHKRYCRKLRTGRRIRKSRWLTGPGHGAVVRDMTMIDQRPAEVETKQQAGHWEGDLIIGVRSGSAMMTLRERKTQYGIVVNLPADHTAETVNAAAIKAFAPLPAHLKRTLTWDQGVEMARHRELAAASGISIYFAERSSPWQRGANENFNGLLRQYFPKGTDLSIHADSHVAVVMRELNTRPRKGLDYDTPQARFRIEARSPQPSIPAAAVSHSAT